MRRDSRLSGVLHVLLHMAEQKAPVTSEALAKAMDTNAVVIRRIMSGLRDHGYVRSEKGHGGGWTLARELATISLRDVYEALGRPSLFAVGNRTESPGCLVEQAVNAALDQAFEDAEAPAVAPGQRHVGDVEHRFSKASGGPAQPSSSGDRACNMIQQPSHSWPPSPIPRRWRDMRMGHHASCPALPICTA